MFDLKFYTDCNINLCHIYIYNYTNKNNSSNLSNSCFNPKKLLIQSRGLIVLSIQISARKMSGHS